MKLNRHTAWDEEALEALIKETYPKVYAYVYRRIMDPAMAKDISQETFYQFFAHLDTYEEKGKTLNYLYRIAYHLICDTYKHQVPVEEYQEAAIKDTTYDGQRLFQTKQNQQTIRAYIRELPPHLQEVLLLRYDENLKYRDISRITGLHVSTVKSQVRLALALLRKRMEKEGWK